MASRPCLLTLPALSSAVCCHLVSLHVGPPLPPPLPPAFLKGLLCASAPPGAEKAEKETRPCPQRNSPLTWEAQKEGNCMSCPAVERRVECPGGIGRGRALLLSGAGRTLPAAGVPEGKENGQGKPNRSKHLLSVLLEGKFSSVHLFP